MLSWDTVQHIWLMGNTHGQIRDLLSYHHDIFPVSWETLSVLAAYERVGDLVTRATQ